MVGCWVAIGVFHLALPVCCRDSSILSHPHIPTDLPLSQTYLCHLPKSMCQGFRFLLILSFFSLPLLFLTGLLLFSSTMEVHCLSPSYWCVVSYRCLLGMTFLPSCNCNGCVGIQVHFSLGHLTPLVLLCK